MSVEFAEEGGLSAAVELNRVSGVWGADDRLGRFEAREVCFEESCNRVRALTVHLQTVLLPPSDSWTS